MRPSRAALLVFGLLATVLARPKDGSDHDGDDDDKTSSNSTSTTNSTTSGNSTTAADPTAQALIGMNGDSVCTSLMCIGGLVNGSDVQYTLQSLGGANLGWMAIGFGAQMANTPMVIMWPNSDGTVTLSPRKAPGEVMPTVDSAPPRTATAQPSSSLLTGSNPKLVFTIPASSNSGSSIIWAYSSANPGSSSIDASLVQHLDSGPTTLDLTKTLTMTDKDPRNPITTIADALSGSTTDSGSGSDTTFQLPPLLPYQKYAVAHAIICTLGFIVFLPLGAIIARNLRSFNNVWFKLHWIIQWVIAMPLIVVGFALGVHAVHLAGVPHQFDTHMKWGAALFALYLVQISFGGIIHFFKPRSKNGPLFIRGRSIQNYFHAILGIFIIGAAFYQVRTGFKTEWPTMTGRGQVSNAANIVWIIWLIVVLVAYWGGMVLLPRQYRQEHSSAAMLKSESGTPLQSMTKPERTY